MKLVNKKICKSLWDGIHQIISSKKKKDSISPSSLLVNVQIITDKLSIAENFSNFYTSIQKKLHNKIYLTNRDYLKALHQIPSLHHQPDLWK